MRASIVCAVDRTTPAGTVVVAARLARAAQARLVLAHVVVDVHRPRSVWRDEEVDAMRADEAEAGTAMLRRVAATAGVLDEAELRCQTGEPVATLTRIADEEAAELLVVAPRDQHPLRSLVSGSVSAALGRTATCPVVAVPRAVAQRYASELALRADA